jgi:hypothetical protein
MCYFLSDLFFNSPYNFFVYKHPITTVNYMLNHHITVLYITSSFVSLCHTHSLNIVNKRFACMSFDENLIITNILQITNVERSRIPWPGNQCFYWFLARLFEEKKVELLSASGSIKFFVRVHFSKTIKGIHLKLGILVHYQKRNQLQQGRWPCDLYIKSYLPLFRHVHVHRN